jgi:hypothetical protein
MESKVPACRVLWWNQTCCKDALMTRKIPLTLVLLVLWAAQAQSASLSYVATFESQWLQELHTEDADICVFGDSDCYPALFRIDPGLAPALMPFAGLTQGTKLPVTLSLDSTGDSGTCWIGGLFTCPANTPINVALFFGMQ